MRWLVCIPLCGLAFVWAGRPLATSPAISAAAKNDACFGGATEILLQGEDEGEYTPNGDATPLFVGSGHLIWQGPWEGPGLLNLTTRKHQHVRLGDRSFFETADAREVYGLSPGAAESRESNLDLVAVDIATGTRRTVVAAGGDRLGLSSYTRVALDGDHATFIRPTPSGGTPDDDDGFFRVRKDGTGVPERIGAEPAGVRTPFAIHEGHVYWHRDNGTDGPAMWRRALVPGSPVERLAPTKGHHLSFFIAHGQLFYPDLPGTLTMPLAASTPPTLLVSNTRNQESTVVADRACVYWTQAGGIFRARLDRPGTAEMIADEDTYRGGPIVTDGQRLYWMDIRHNRILRILGMGRSAASPPKRPALVAKPMDGKALPADSASPDSRLLVGDGWGCAKVFAWSQPHWQCWNAGAQVGPVKARSVPGLVPEAEPALGADRLCFLDGKMGKCWSWAELASGKPSGFLEPQTRRGRLGQWLVGGTSSCLLQYVGAERMLACLGDNRYGQLALKSQPVALEPWRATLGAFHGCVSSSDIHCWGRGDAGQLGRAATSTCLVNGQEIPCDPNLARTDFTLPQVRALFAGDLFTCAALEPTREIRCWGGSRDGWLGDTPCPPGLRQAWPVGAGSVAAPRSTCSAKPIAITTPGKEIGEVSIGPRGMCLVENGKPRCLGAIFTPSSPVSKIAVGNGAQANACGIDGTRVVCWGEGYSPQGQPSQVVPITFESTPIASAVIDTPPPAGTTWPQEKLIHQGCPREPITLPTCQAKATGEPWAKLMGKADSLAKQRVSVRDRLVVGPLEEAYPSWTRKRGEERRIVLGGKASPLRIHHADYKCTGDESRLCCEVPAFGQTVIATGVLTESAHGWGLDDPTVCEVPR